ncbi:hypothetical protein CHU98_g1359 [Xylaria longipes]|nr:hypothetical protein CHU98_g1359 [Xylaria longipes]
MMDNSSVSQPIPITVEVPNILAVCSILGPEFNNGSVSGWHAVWSCDKALCDRYKAAQYNICELQTDLMADHNFTFSHCATTRLAAPATLQAVGITYPYDPPPSLSFKDDEEVPSEPPHPLYQAKVDMGKESFEKGLP